MPFSGASCLKRKYEESLGNLDFHAFIPMIFLRYEISERAWKRISIGVNPRAKGEVFVCEEVVNLAAIGDLKCGCQYAA